MTKRTCFCGTPLKLSQILCPGCHEPADDATLAARYGSAAQWAAQEWTRPGLTDSPDFTANVADVAARYARLAASFADRAYRARMRSLTA